MKLADRFGNEVDSDPTSRPSGMWPLGRLLF